MSRRPVFAHDTLARSFKSRRTFNASNRVAVRVLVADGPLSATSAAGWSSQAARSGGSVLICAPVSRRQAVSTEHFVRLIRPGSTLLPQSDTNEGAIVAVIRPRFTSSVLPRHCIKHRSRGQRNPGRRGQTSTTSFGISEPLAKPQHISFDNIQPRISANNELHPPLQT